MSNAPRSPYVRLPLKASILLCLSLLLRSHPSTAFAPPKLAPSRAFLPSPLLAATASSPSTIQILMSDTGGGHRASANALRDALDVLYPGRITVDIVDIYTDYGPFFPFDSYVGLYKIMAEYPFLWKWFYEFGSTPFGLWLNEFSLELFCFDGFKECMGRDSGDSGERAQMVVSVHPLCQDIPLKILAELDSGGKTRAAEGRTKTPFVTVVTDLGGAHPTWFSPNVDKCFVPGDVLARCALDRNIPPSKIIQYGLPIRKGFWENQESPTKKTAAPSPSWLDNLFGNAATTTKSASPTQSTTQKTDMQTKLNLLPGLPTVLVVGGGDGMGGIIQTARSLGTQLHANPNKDEEGDQKYQMVVICGNNQKAQQALSTDTQWGDNVNVDVQGFVNNMEEYMKASDVIVTKAGPGTIAEASICGLPCVLSSFLPGQEEGNVPFVEEAGFGTYSGDPKIIASTVSDWLSDPQKLEDMKYKALEAARPKATLDIARDIGEMVLALEKD